MKYLITNNQLNLLMESDDDKILMFPNPERLGGWDILQQLLEKRGNPRYGIRGDLNLRGLSIESFGDLKSFGSLEYVEGNLDLDVGPIKSLGSLEYVGGNLNLFRSFIQSLGNLKHVGGHLDLENTNIESLGNLKHVGDFLSLYGVYHIQSLGNLEYVGNSLYLTKSGIKSLGNLKYVGGNLHLRRTPLSKTTTAEEIRSKINVVGDIYI
jgi:hypothetical protein